MPNGNGMNPTKNYNPDVFVYDDEAREGEIGQKVILDEQGNEIEIIKTFGTGKADIIDQNDFMDWGDDEEDEILIEKYFESLTRP